MQVIVNLLSNAVKFAGSGQVTLQASAIDNDRIEIRVSDTGPGVPEEEKEKIFNKFYQVRAHRPTDRKHPLGTGLGLAICKQIVTHYGGTIWVESEPGCGSTFIFQLPTGRSDIHRRLAKTA
jgi:signal transduction histidine kinase